MGKGVWVVYILRTIEVNSHTFCLQKRYSNKPIVELEIAAQEQMKITELRLAKLFSTKLSTATATEHQSVSVAKANGNMLFTML